jgi:NitT/TauT family transport system substrate-binding protein
MDARRRQLLTLAAAASAMQFTRPASAASTGKTTRVSIALAAKQSLYHLPLTLAEQLGFFRQLGLSVEFLAHDAGAHAMASLASGQADVAAGAFEHVFNPNPSGHKHQAFVLMGRSPQVSMGISSRLARVKSLAELKGAKVGVTSLGSSTHTMASQWLMMHGVLPEDVSFVEVGSSSSVWDTLRSGGIDVLCNPDPIMHWLEMRNEVLLVGEARSLQGAQQVMGGAVPGASLIAREEFLQRQPEVAQALADGVVHALKWLQTAGPTDLFRSVPSAYWMNDRAAYLGAFEKLRESYAIDGVIQEETVLNLWRAQARLTGRLQTSRALLARTFSNKFALQSKRKFKA